MSIESILQELKKERDQLDRAISALEGSNISSRKIATKGTSAASGSSNRRGGITAAGRKRLSEAMKKRWAERRKKSM